MEEPGHELAVVVVSFDAREDLLACLASVRQAAAVIDVRTELIVVDNGSSDGSADAVRASFPEATLLERPENLGFAGGVDVGLRAASAPWRLTLNNDAVLRSDALGVLLDTSRQVPDDVGVLAAQMRFSSRPDVVNSAGIEVDAIGVATDRHLGAPVSGEPDEPLEVFGASAGAALYRAEMLADVGGFDPSWFLYLEDVDLAWRARQRGWRALYVPRAVVLHHHSASAVHGSPLKHYWVGRNRIRTLARNMPRRRLADAAVAILLHEIAHTAFVVATTRSLAPLSGRIDGLRRWRSTRASWQRTDVDLVPRSGIRSALRRRRTWPTAAPRVESDPASSG